MMLRNGKIVGNTNKSQRAKKRRKLNKNNAKSVKYSKSGSVAKNNSPSDAAKQSNIESKQETTLRTIGDEDNAPNIVDNATTGNTDDNCTPESAGDSDNAENIDEIKEECYDGYPNDDYETFYEWKDRYVESGKKTWGVGVCWEEKQNGHCLWHEIGECPYKHTH